MQLTMYHPSTSALRAEALFASVLQRSDRPSPGQRGTVPGDSRTGPPAACSEGWREHEAHPHHPAEEPA